MSLLDTASLIVTPNGYKEGKLYSVIPSDGSGDLSVTRATTATRVNSAGLVELVPYNLVQYSEDFSNGAWTKTALTISANATTAPNGNLTADKINEDSSNNFHVTNFANGITPSGTNTLSVYAKAGERQWIWVYLFDGVAGSLFAWFDVANGTIGTVQSGLTANIEDAGNGWFRCSVTRTQANSGNGGFGLATADNVLSYTGTTGSGVYAWGAQLVEGSVAKDYQKTETRLNIPRLDYSNGTCPSILVEPQRTNIATYSQDATQWLVGLTGATLNVTSNQSVSPDGTQNADKIVFSSVSGAGNYALSYYELTASAAAYSGSIYLKGENGGEVVYLMYTPDAVTYTSVACTLTTSWQRFSITSNLSAGTQYFQIGVDLRDSAQSAKPSQTIYVWGRQLELGSYPTSYIPTTSASVTRNADVISKTGISSLIGQTEGAVMIDINIDSSFAQNDMRFIDVSDGSTANWYFIGTNNANEIRFYFRSSNTAYVSFTTTLTNGRHKLAFAYKNNDYVAYVDGVQVHSTTTLAVGSTSKVTLGNDFGGFNPSKQFINASALWKTRLTNTQLAQLTTI